MKVCFISNQIAAWGKIGGFGTATRAIGAGLVEQGVEVCAVVPRRARNGQQAIETLDGITVHGVSSWETFASGRVFRELNADIYHSQEPTIASYWAQRAAPGAIHVVTCRDPRSLNEHLIELRYTNYKRRLLAPVTWYYEASPWVKAAVQRAAAVLSPAPSCLHDKIKRLYGLRTEPQFVPSPVELPQAPPHKSDVPTVLFVGRWDHRKRLEHLIDLADQFRDVHFIIVGRAHDASYDRRLRERFCRLPNVELPGYVSRFDSPGLWSYYERAWILINTSAREGLPYTFVEALAWGCAILACLNPDDLAERFGCYVPDHDFAGGLRRLLDGNHWHRLGTSGAGYVASIFERHRSIAQHVQLYNRLLHEQSR